MKLSKLRSAFQRGGGRRKVTLLDLPPEIIGDILAMAAVVDHIACLRTCKHLAHIGDRQWVWRRRYYADFGECDNDTSIADWKHTYASQYRTWALRPPHAIPLSRPETPESPSPRLVYDADFDAQSLAVSAWSDGVVCVSRFRAAAREDTLFNCDAPVYACLVDSERHAVYLGTDAGKCLVLCTRTMQICASTTIFASGESVLRALKAPCGIVFGGASGTLSLMEPSAGSKPAIARLAGAHSAAINGLAYSAKYGRVVSLSCNGRVKMWQWCSRRRRFICCAKYTPSLTRGDSSCLAVYGDSFYVGGQADGSIQAFSLLDGGTQGELAGHQRQVRTMHVDGHHMVTGSYDCTVRIWDLRTKALLQTIGASAAKSHWVLCVRLNRAKVVYGAGSDCNLLEFR